jgi:hypothetical protein
MTDEGFADLPATDEGGEAETSTSPTAFADVSFAFTFNDPSGPSAPQESPDPSQGAGTPGPTDLPDAFALPSGIDATDSAPSNSAPNSVGDDTEPIYLSDPGRASSHDFAFPGEPRNASGPAPTAEADPKRAPDDNFAASAPDFADPFAGFQAPKKKDDPTTEFTDPFTAQPKADQAREEHFAHFTAPKEAEETSPEFDDPFAGFEAPKKKEQPKPQLGGGFADPAATMLGESDQAEAATASFSASPKKDEPSADSADPSAARTDASSDLFAAFESPKKKDELAPEFADPFATQPKSSDDPFAGFEAPKKKDEPSPTFSDPSARSDDPAKKKEEAAPELPDPSAAPAENLFVTFSAGQDANSGFSFSPEFNDGSAVGSGDGFSFDFGGDGSGFAFHFGDGQAAADGFVFPAQSEAGGSGDSGFTFTFSASDVPGEGPPEDDEGPSEEAYQVFRDLIMNSVFDQPKADAARLFDKPDPTDNVQAALASLLKN